MKKNALAVIVMLSLAGALRAGWPLEPKDFRGVPFGATQAAARAIIEPKPPADAVTHIHCVNEMLSDPRFAKLLSPVMRAELEKSSKEHDLCSQSFKIGAITTEQAFLFVKDKFVQVNLSFDSDVFTALRDIFVERYGPPTESRTEPVQTKSGSTFENTVVVWIGEKVNARIQRYSDTINKGSASIYHQAWGDADLKAREEAKKKAAATF